MRKLLLLLLLVSNTFAFRYIEEKVVIGNNKVKPSSGAILQLSSTSGGFLGPVMTPTERDAITTPANGVMVYNSTLDQYEYWDGSAWSGIGSGGSGSGITEWEVSTGYAVGDVVYATGDKVYVAESVHTSDATTFATDFGLGYWTLLSEGIKSSGDIVTDNSVIRYDGTGGEDAQGSNVLIDDSDAVSGITQLSVDNLDIDGNSITSTDTNGNIILNPDGTGQVNLPDLTTDRLAYIDSSGNLTTTDYSSAITGTANQVIVTDNGSTVTLSTPQDIDSTSDVTFNGLTLSGLNPSEYVITDGSSVLTTTATLATADITGILSVDKGGTGIDGSSAANGSLLIGNGTGYDASFLTGTANQIGITNGAGSITITASQDISTVSTPEFAGVYSTDALRVSGLAPPSAPAASSYLLYPKTDGKWYKQNSSGDETTIENLSLDIFHQATYEGSLTTSDFTSGNNADFDNGGTLNGTLADETTDEINGLVSGSYTQGASSINDWIASPTIALSKKQRESSSDIVVSFYYTYDGSNDDIKFVAYDSTNGDVLTSTLDLLQVASKPTRFSTSFPVNGDSSTANIKYGFQVVGSSNGAELIWDDLELSTNPFIYKDLIKTSSVRGAGNGGAAITASTTDIDFTEVSDTHGAWDGDSYSVQSSDSIISIKGGVNFTTSAAQGFAIYKGGTLYRYLTTQSTSYDIHGFEFISEKGEFTIGDVLSIRAYISSQTLNNSTTAHWININEQWETEHVITPAKSNVTDWQSYTPTFTGFGTVSTESFLYRRVGDTLHVKGRFTSGTPTAVTAEISIPSGLVIDANKIPTVNYQVGKGFRNIVGAGAGNDLNILGTSNTDSISIGLHDIAGYNPITAENGNQIVGVGDIVSLEFSVPIAGWSSDTTLLAAIPVQKVAILKDIKAYTAGCGTSFSTTHHTRELTSIEGDTSFVSLASDQFTLIPGKYIITASAASFRGAQHFLYLHDGTSIVGEAGSTAYSNTANNDQARAFLRNSLTLTSSTTLELRHYITGGIATNGLGFNTNVSGYNTTCAEVKIVKVY